MVQPLLIVTERNTKIRNSETLFSRKRVPETRVSRQLVTGITNFKIIKKAKNAELRHAW